MTLPDATMQEEIQRLEELRNKKPRGHTFARLADLYRKSGQPLQGLEVVEAGLEHHPHYLNAHLVHAKILRELGRRQDAEAAFSRVLEIDEENLIALQAIEDLNRPAPPVGPISQSAKAAELGIVRAGGDETPTEPPRASASSWLAQLEAEWQETREPAANGAGAETTVEPSVESSVEPSAEPLPEAERDEGQAGEPAGELAGDTAGEPAGDTAEEAAVEPESAATEASEPPGVGVPDEAPRAPDSTDVGEPGDDPAVAMATATLAELYCRQGLYEEAISVYEKLLARDPYNAQLAASLDDTRRLSKRGHRRGGGASPPPPDSVPLPDPTAVPVAVPGQAPVPDPAPATSRAPDSSRAPVSQRDPVEPTGTRTIREQLTSIMEGGAQVSPSPRPGAAERLRRWLIESMGTESD